MTPVAHRLSLENIEQAFAVSAPVLRDSPQLVHKPLSDLIGMPLLLKTDAWAGNHLATRFQATYPHV